jgi:alkylation response protein AidB-like acyl-CoA dehydrogenase
MLSAEQQEIVAMVRDFTDHEILPRAEEHDHADSFPEEIVAGMQEIGLFGAMIPEQYGGMGLDLFTYTLIVEQLSRGWISISGIINTHFIGAYLLTTFGTDEQKQRYLPRMASGEMRAAFSISEPEAGSDAQNIKTTAQQNAAGHWLINGQKMWVTNGLRSSLVFLLARSDLDAEPRHRGMGCFITEKQPGANVNDGPFQGLTVSAPIAKLGYKGVESTELIYDDYLCPAENVLGADPQAGFQQMMNALEVGRVNVAARGVGLGQRALELALQYSQERQAFGRPIAEHQAVAFRLAEMATDVAAARQLTYFAAQEKDRTGQARAEAGMAKLLASEAAVRVVEQSFRIHGGYGYSKEYEIERLYRDAPLLLIGEGTSDIQKMLIARSLRP